jgi:hypothetical protein
MASGCGTRQICTPIRHAKNGQKRYREPRKQLQEVAGRQQEQEDKVNSSRTGQKQKAGGGCSDCVGMRKRETEIVAIWQLYTSDDLILFLAAYSLNIVLSILHCYAFLLLPEHLHAFWPLWAQFHWPRE